MVVGGQHHAAAALPSGKTRYPLYRRLGGPQDRSGRVRKISPPPAFDPRTVQPVASRYTDCAIPAAMPSQRISITYFYVKCTLWEDNRAGQTITAKETEVEEVE